MIVLALAWAWYEGKADRPIFLPETIALGAFAISWLVKGRAGRTLKAVAQNFKRQPRRFMKKVVMGA